MIFKLPYGNSILSAKINEKRILGVLEGKKLKKIDNISLEILKAINNPIGCLSLKNQKFKKSNVVIIVNDITRPCPTAIILEVLVAELNNLGVRDNDITIVIATGTHRPSTSSEIKYMLGKMADRIKVICHDCQDEKNLTFVGTTSENIDIYANKVVVNANVRILIGTIVPHQSAGFSGGRKSLVPGVTSLNTLKKHHSFPIRPFKPAYGWLHGNPFHEQAVEGARLIGVDFIINVVPNSNKEIVAVVAGDLELAHEAGVDICRQMCELTIAQQADIVIVSPGGFPRDMNLYQAQKAIAVAEMAVMPGGVIILVAECREPIEDNDFPRWLKAADTPMNVIERFQKEGFNIGSAKAFSFARACQNFNVVVVSNNICENELSNLFLKGARNLENALKIAEEIVGDNSKIFIIPNGNNIIIREGVAIKATYYPDCS